MGKKYIILCVLFLATGCFTQGTAIEPQAQTDPYLWDFGQAREGEILKHDFMVYNDSGATLKIKNVTTSCGCTISEVQKKILSSGESTVLSVQFNTRGYFGPTQKLINVQTDSLKKPVLTYKIKAEIIIPKDDPYLWDFGQVKKGEILKHDFVLRNDSAQTLNIKEITTSCGCTVSEAQKKTLLPGESTVLSVHFDTKDYSGAVHQFIYVNSDRLDNPIIRFIIKAEVVK